MQIYFKMCKAGAKEQQEARESSCWSAMVEAVPPSLGFAWKHLLLLLVCDFWRLFIFIY
jgi:hypothetical protein